MATISNFEDLEIWQLARQQAVEVYQLYIIEPFSRDWELKNQINAASGSVMDNIAEGFERSGNKEFLNFLLIAKGSNGQVRSQLYRAFDRKYITEEKFDELKNKCLTISKKITSFIKYLKDSEKKGFRYS
ncbi:MAG: four helix bundle protein [Ferruginibacter sp.]|nr:four helix bundle protein [Ferruginibacter sp.]